MVGIEVLKNRIIKEIKASNDHEYDDRMNRIDFYMEDGDHYLMWHCQDCCESVALQEVIGDINDLVGNPIIEAEEVSNSGQYDEEYETYTWTFYKLRTVKGFVTLRWLGTSNGYYSEHVDFEKV